MSNGTSRKGKPSAGGDHGAATPTWNSWVAQGLPLPVHRKAGGRIHDPEWVGPRIQRHLELHPERPTGTQDHGVATSVEQHKIHRAPGPPPQITIDHRPMERGADGLPAKIHTTVSCQGKSGRVVTSLKNGAIIIEDAFLNQIPEEAQWVNASGQVVPQSRGMRLSAHINQKHAELLNVSPGDFGPKIKEVLIDNVIDRETLVQLCSPNGYRAITPRRDHLLTCHSVVYAQRAITSFGGVVKNPTIRSIGWRDMSPAEQTFYKPVANGNPKLPENLIIALECEVGRPGALPDRSR
jgi:hypothetical protein